MLVLSRQRDETIEIGKRNECLVPLPPQAVNLVIAAINDCRDMAPAVRDSLVQLFAAAEAGPIKITVVDIRGDKVRLGTGAAKCLEVHRTEVADAIEREVRDAAKRANDARLERAGA